MDPTEADVEALLREAMAIADEVEAVSEAVGDNEEGWRLRRAMRSTVVNLAQALRVLRESDDQADGQV